jgi:hypothetical protein
MKHQKHRKHQKSHADQPRFLSASDIAQYVDTKPVAQRADWKDSIREVFKPTRRR